MNHQAYHCIAWLSYAIIMPNSLRRKNMSDQIMLLALQFTSCLLSCCCTGSWVEQEFHDLKRYPAYYYVKRPLPLCCLPIYCCNEVCCTTITNMEAALNKEIQQQKMIILKKQSQQKKWVFFMEKGRKICLITSCFWYYNLQAFCFHADVPVVLWKNL